MPSHPHVARLSPPRGRGKERVHSGLHKLSMVCTNTLGVRSLSLCRRERSELASVRLDDNSYWGSAVIFSERPLCSESDMIVAPTIQADSSDLLKHRPTGSVRV